MPRYNFVCEPCEGHDETVYREVFMSISHFSDDGRHQVCDVCGREMRHILGMPAVHWKGPGSQKKQIPQERREEVTKELEHNYYEQAKSSGELDEARDTSETVRINRWRNTKTGKKIDVPVEEA
jgi:predicted nucleic acid-binding Zn ribbon protein